MTDSSERGSKINWAAQRSMRLRSEAELQGVQTATIGSDESAEVMYDRVVNGGTSRPMTTDGKGEEHSPTKLRDQNSRRSMNEFVAAGAKRERVE